MTQFLVSKIASMSHEIRVLAKNLSVCLSCLCVKPCWGQVGKSDLFPSWPLVLGRQSNISDVRLGGGQNPLRLSFSVCVGPSQSFLCVLVFLCISVCVSVSVLVYVCVSRFLSVCWGLISLAPVGLQGTSGHKKINIHPTSSNLPSFYTITPSCNKYLTLSPLLSHHCHNHLSLTTSVHMMMIRMIPSIV